MYKLKIEGILDESEFIVYSLESIINIDLKEDYLIKVVGHISKLENYSMGKDIINIISDRKVDHIPLIFIYGKAEMIECGILFSSNDELKILGCWPNSLFEAIKKDADIFKSLLYRFIKTPEFFNEVTLFNYTKSVEVKKIEPPIPKIPQIQEKEPSEEGYDKDYLIPELPYKKKITTKVSIDFLSSNSSETEKVPNDVPESYGESLISEIEEIASSFRYEGMSKEEEEQMEFWDSCPFCFTHLSKNTIKLLKAGLSTFCPNNKCRKLIKAEYMVKEVK